MIASDMAGKQFGNLSIISVGYFHRHAFGESSRGMDTDSSHAFADFNISVVHRRITGKLSALTAVDSSI
jgi:hypothetical protein